MGVSGSKVKSGRQRVCFRRTIRDSATVHRPTAAPVGTDPEPALPALHILLAEDSAGNCIITMAYLEDTPYQVEIAEMGHRLQNI